MVSLSQHDNHILTIFCHFSSCDSASSVQRLKFTALKSSETSHVQIWTQTAERAPSSKQEVLHQQRAHEYFSRTNAVATPGLWRSFALLNYSKCLKRPPLWLLRGFILTNPLQPSLSPFLMFVLHLRPNTFQAQSWGWFLRSRSCIIKGAGVF